MTPRTAGRSSGSARPRAGRPAPSPLLDEEDLYLFNEGKHTQIYRKLGARPLARRGGRGTHFAVWAPNAQEISLIGTFNAWTAGLHRLEHRGSSGLFEGSFADVPAGSLYKYRILGRDGAPPTDKADPVGFRHETPPGTASQVWDLSYRWHDAAWRSGRAERSAVDAPVSIYEVHVGSWRRVPEEGHRPLSYRELARPLVEHVRSLGFTHVEFLPLMEHPFYGSWGYEPTGYFAPTSRYGTPQDLMFLVDELHRAGIGAVLDWVPSHFPADAHALGLFDGTHLYEHADPRRGWHPDWHTYIFNYGRHEVRSFLASSANFWLDVYHFDALRFDGVASMLYLDYSRAPGEWVPNEHGGRENEDAVRLLRWINEVCYRERPGTQTVAEESTAWPGVSRPTSAGGLGFGYKWDMGWMHDTLEYLARDPVHRSHHHDRLTFRMLYAYDENFILPLSHDEVVYGKGSLVGRMPGDGWQKRANLRLLLTYQYTLPGKKLLFMGGEFGQEREWTHEESLDWHLLELEEHQGLQRWVSQLNRIYRATPPLFARDYDRGGFEWIDTSDRSQSVLSFLRWGPEKERPLLVVLNFTPVPRRGYRLGVPRAGTWTPCASSDRKEFGGTGDYDPPKEVLTDEVPFHGRPHSLTLDLPPLGAVLLRGPA